MSDLRFAIADAAVEPYAAAPTIRFRLAVTDGSGGPIHAVALRAQVWIETQRRHYRATEEERLFELFGEPNRWGDTLRPVLWTHVGIMIPAFTGRVEVDVPVMATYDFEVAAAKYFHALEDGEIPLLFQFSGSVFAQGPGGLSVDQVAWDREASYRLPVAVWREMMDGYFPHSAWIRVRRETLDALHRFRGREVLTSWDDTLEALLRRAEAGEREPV